MSILSFYFNPAGRISRSQFWLGFIGLILIEVLFNYWMAVSLFGRDWLEAQSAPLAKPALQLSALVNVIFLFPNYVVFGKRFHDRSKSAMWALIIIAADLLAIGLTLLGLIGPIDHPSPIAMAAGGLQLLVLLWVIIELGCLRGTPGVNTYGPDPLARP